MQAETWEKLNGMGFGEIAAAKRQVPCGNSLPQSAEQTAPSSDGALQIPEFMRSDYISVSTVVPVSAYRAQGMGRVKRAQHLRDRRVRHVVNGVFWFLVGVGAFVLVSNLFLWLADKMA